MQGTGPIRSRGRDIAVTIVMGTGRFIVGIVLMALYLALFLWSPWRPDLRLDRRFRRASDEEA